MLSSTLTHLQKVMQNKIYQLGQLLPVWPSSKLLAATRHQTLLHEIQQLSALPEPHFKALCRPAINHYAEFTQVIPEDPQGALGGLLNMGLARALLGLRQFAADAGGKLDADPLVNYAILTAGLFFDAAKVVSQQKVVICDDAGRYSQEWYPYLGSMVDQNMAFYKMYPYHTTMYQALDRDAAALFARQMMPSEAFAWLSSDLELFIDWLDALRGEGGRGGRRITRVLSLIRQEDLIALMKNLSQMPVELIALKEMQPEDQFYLWLREGLANGSIALNTSEAYVHLLDDGALYLNNKIFETFEAAKKTVIDIRKFSERFGLGIEAAPDKVEYAAFLTQRTEKTIQVRKGMFALGSSFLIDRATVDVPNSPLQEKIRAAFQQSRQLPTVKQTLIQQQGPSFSPRR